MFKKFHKCFALFAVLFSVPVLLFAQIESSQKNTVPMRGNIEGAIMDAMGVAIAVCTVQNKKTGQSTFSDKTGHFLIAAASGDTLLISHTNYLSETVIVTTAVTLNIRLQNREGLQEEVFVSSGYQRISKARTTGAFSKINAAVLKEQVSPDILSRLKNVSNVYFDTKNLSDRRTNITLRGLSTINGNTAPLIVLDNFPIMAI